jgi:hypothetical protein
VPVANVAHLNQLAISPDEQTIVLGGAKGGIVRIDADGTLARVPFEGSVSTVAWGRDANHVLLGTQEGAAHASYGLVELGLDGSTARLWSSPTMWVGGLRAFGDGHRYAATVRAHQFELLVLEPQ